MVSNRDRQRAAARARLEKNMQERADQASRRRRRQTLIGAVAGSLVLVIGVVWLVVAVASDDQPKPKASAASGCVWHPLVDPNADDAVTPSGTKEVGTPPKDVPRSGLAVMTIGSSLGDVKIEMDLTKTPCAVASFTHLASKGFYDGTECHRLVPDIFALQCGDPVGTGAGGPTYRYDEENLQTGKVPAYSKGDVAVARGKAKGTNGSQFFFVYGDASTLPGDYTLLGRVVQGLDIVEKVGNGGHDDAWAQDAGGGRPNVKWVFESVKVEPVTEPADPGAAGSGAATSDTAPASPEPAPVTS